MAVARLHNFVIDNDQTKFNVGDIVDLNDPTIWGAETLGDIPQAPNNNGFLYDSTTAIDNN